MGERCIDGRLFRHRPFPDDPAFEHDVGQCPECEGRGCSGITPELIAQVDADHGECIATIDQLATDKSRIAQHAAALERALAAIISEPFGCAFCDSGKLRNPSKPHDEECGFALAALTPPPAHGGR